MYSIFTIGVAAVIALAATFFTTSPSPAQETASTSNIPTMYEIDWSQDMSPEAEYAFYTFYVCEHSPRGHAAMEDMLNTLGSFTFTDNVAEKRTRAETMYGLASQHIQEGACRWSNYETEYFLSGALHSTEEYDLSQVQCTTLPNGICAYIQPMKDMDEKGTADVVYSLFTDTDDEIMWKEMFGGEQWGLIN